MLWTRCAIIVYFLRSWRWWGPYQFHPNLAMRVNKIEDEGRKGEEQRDERTKRTSERNSIDSARRGRGKRDGKKTKLSRGGERSRNARDDDDRSGRHWMGRCFVNNFSLCCCCRFHRHRKLGLHLLSFRYKIRRGLHLFCCFLGASSRLFCPLRHGLLYATRV